MVDHSTESGTPAANIEVTLRCFSHLRQRLGVAALPLELPAGATTADVVQRVRGMLGPGLERMVFRIAVNRDFVDGHENVVLQHGDEVALLPPMQGGRR